MGCLQRCPSFRSTGGCRVKPSQTASSGPIRSDQVSGKRRKRSARERGAHRGPRAKYSTRREQDLAQRCHAEIEGPRPGRSTWGPGKTGSWSQRQRTWNCLDGATIGLSRNLRAPKLTIPFRNEQATRKALGQGFTKYRAPRSTPRKRVVTLRDWLRKKSTGRWGSC